MLGLKREKSSESEDKTPIAAFLQLLGAIEEESKLCLGTGAGRHRSESEDRI